MKKRIGVLALQGGFAEHITMLQTLDVQTVEVRLPKHLEQIDGLIIPGGESTTVSRLLRLTGLFDPIKVRVDDGMAIWGTCAGAILLAKHVANLEPKGLEVMDITVERNAFGRQIDSFEMELSFSEIGAEPFNAIFIRAPIIKDLGKHVKSLIQLPDNTIVAAKQGKMLATSFHPELGNDHRFHKYFLGMCG
jgi:pyridoxal 5'-phosphate synthase pdxT subunit